MFAAISSKYLDYIFAPEFLDQLEMTRFRRDVWRPHYHRVDCVVSIGDRCTHGVGGYLVVATWKEVSTLGEDQGVLVARGDLQDVQLGAGVDEGKHVSLYCVAVG